MASASASMPDIGRTMTINSLIAPSSSSWMKSHPSTCLSPTLASNTSAWSRSLIAADLACVTEVFEHRRDGFQQPAHRLAAVIRLEDGGAAKNHVLAHQGDGGIDVHCFDRATERMHHLTTSIVN